MREALEGIKNDDDGEGECVFLGWEEVRDTAMGYVRRNLVEG